MPEMILPFDYTLSSLSGRSMEFKAGEPTYVIPEIVAEATAIGAVLAADYVQPAAPEAVVEPVIEPVTEPTV